MRIRNGLARGTCILFSLAAALLPLSGATDLGQTAADTPQTASIIFKLRDAQGLERFVAQSAGGGFGFRQFLSTEQFAQAFGPAEKDFQQVLHFLKAQGLTIDEVYDSHMVIRATGTTAQFNTLLGTVLHTYKDHGRTYQKPSCAPKVPEQIQDIVLLVAGMDTELFAQAHHTTTAAATRLGESQARMVLPAGGAGATGVPGSFTVGDVANLYNINPLYKDRITGRGQTLGIATLASFSQADAYTYWSAVGLKVDPNRIQEIAVDGGAGTDGADETTLDVEQSGGLAYQAKIKVYEAPNTYSGFLDLFYKAISDNKVDTLSTSWGESEVFLDGDTLTAYHQVFLEAAAQGIPVFASAGDAGAFDFNGAGYPTPSWAPTNSVDSPASDPMVTAAGGLTLPTSIQFLYGTVTVPQVRPWGWDFLEDYIVTYHGMLDYWTNFFPVGGGGGVSTSWAVPAWQAGLPGVQTSSPDFSSFEYYPAADYPNAADAVNEGYQPVGYAGRNLPDVSLNADPYTGYLVYFQGGWYSGFGGTSFVAPQLNGIAALASQAAGGRLGTLNPQLYNLYERFGYGPHSPFTAVTTGDNLYWQAGPTYNPASGLGALDATRLTRQLAGD